MLSLASCSGDGGDEEIPLITFNLPHDYPALVNGVSIESCPDRVVALTPVMIEVVFALGSYAQLAGVGENCNYPESAASMKKYGKIGNLDYDALSADGVSLILTSAPLSDAEKLRLITMDIQLVFIEAAFDRNGLYSLYRKTGMVMAGESTGTKNADNTVSRLFSKIDNAAAGESKGKAALILDYGNAVATPDSLAGELLSKAGYTNAAAGTNLQTNMQELAEAKPMYIFCSIEQIDDIMNDEWLKNTPAVENNHVYAVDMSMLSGQGERMFDFVLSLRDVGLGDN